MKINKSINLPGTGFTFLTKKVGAGGPDPMHTNSALPFSLTLTAMEGGPKEETEGMAVGIRNPQ